MVAVLLDRRVLLEVTDRFFDIAALLVAVVVPLYLGLDLDRPGLARPYLDVPGAGRDLQVYRASDFQGSFERSLDDVRPLGRGRGGREQNRSR